MMVSVAEEMNPTYRNTMEDAHAICIPGSWHAPNVRAAFLSVMDGHGGREIADYLEENLATNVAIEWSHSTDEEVRAGGRTTTAGDDDGCGGGRDDDDDENENDGVISRTGKRHRRSFSTDDHEDVGGTSATSTSTTKLSSTTTTTVATTSEKVRKELDLQGEVVRVALERAFFLTDVRSRIGGILTSGATVACCVVIPNYPEDYDDDDENDDDGRGGGRRRRKPTSISIHAANAGDARAVLSSNVAYRRRRRSSSSSSRSITSRGCGGGDVGNKEEASTMCDGYHRRPSLPRRIAGTTIPRASMRLTRDHKSTDPDEVERIVKSGGNMIRGRVLGVLAVTRSIGDHGMKEYVIGRPYVSSTIVDIVEEDDGECANAGEDDDDEYDGEDGRHNTSNDHRRMASDGGGEELSSSMDCSPFTDGEFLIVACDGLWDVMSDQEAVDLVRDHRHRERLRARVDDDDDDDDGGKGAASFLVEEALRRGSMDNITVIAKTQRRIVFAIPSRPDDPWFVQDRRDNALPDDFNRDHGSSIARNHYLSFRNHQKG
ncbi:hypothetical protein ACHAXA_004844 [Cyclostephanos tholiformis]|uniref:PPM-type phosphatase domain-containing protein n=1 Tax=Cyclostephanos tholiformis TaxID=382380 RepID=A0ABD3SH49_9STRA